MKCISVLRCANPTGPTPHGVGGLKYPFFISSIASLTGPTPHGVGGLKSIPYEVYIRNTKSHPTRGGWIEINGNVVVSTGGNGPTPHGVGGLK